MSQTRIDDVQHLAEGKAGSDPDVGIGRSNTRPKHGDQLGNDPLAVLLAELAERARGSLLAGEYEVSLMPTRCGNT